MSRRPVVSPQSLPKFLFQSTRWDDGVKVNAEQSQAILTH